MNVVINSFLWMPQNHNDFQGLNTHDQPVNQLSFAHDVLALPQQPWLPPGIHFCNFLQQTCCLGSISIHFPSSPLRKQQRKLHKSGCFRPNSFNKITWAARHGKPLPGQDLVHCRASLYLNLFDSMLMTWSPWGHISNVKYIPLSGWSGWLWQKKPLKTGTQK